MKVSDQVRLSAQKRFRCLECGLMKRKERFEVRTLDFSKDRDQLIAEMRTELLAWQRQPDTCRACTEVPKPPAPPPTKQRSSPSSLRGKRNRRGPRNHDNNRNGT